MHTVSLNWQYTTRSQMIFVTTLTFALLLNFFTREMTD